MSNFSHTPALGASALAMVLWLGGTQAMAQAQDSGEKIESGVSAGSVPTVVVTSRGTPPAYRLGDRLNTGLTVYDERSITDRAPGTGDVLQILKLNPGVQFTVTEGTATRESLRDLRPSEISISGARPSENLFILDGVGVNYLMDTDVSGSPGGFLDFDAVRGASSQTVWVDSDLVGSLAVHDSNVSAEFGKFTGGVVDIKTRDPSRVFGMRASYSMTTDDFARYQLSPSYTSSVVREKPAFERNRWNISADLPLNETMSLLASYARSEATTYNNWSNNLTDMAGEQFDQTNTSENFMLKYLWQANDNLRLSAQVTHAPYSSLIIATGGINTQQDNKGGGTTARLSASGGAGSGTWDLNLTYALSDADKKAADWRYDVRGGLESWCSGALTVTCANGYVGAITQRQNDLSLNGSWSQPFHGGDLRLGFALTDIEAEKSRRDGGVYSINGFTVAAISPMTGPLTHCASPNDPACYQGRYAYNQKVVYPGYDANVSLQTYALWAEYNYRWNDFDIRAGLRYDHETFLANHTFSPRLSLSRELPWWGINATLGLNRYYGRSFLGYAMREKLPNTLTYGRASQMVNGQRVWSEDWVLKSLAIPQKFSNQELDTPYNDEVSLALTGNLFGGQWRVRGVYREGHDQFARSLADTMTLVDEMGVSKTIALYRMTNDGTSRYESGSLEYVKPWGRHTFSVSTNWSDTKTNASGYYEGTDEDLAGAKEVVFNGKVMTLLELYEENQRLDFATPFMLNMDWQSKWLDDRLSLTIGGRYRGDFDRIESTSSYENVGGTRYQVYEVAHYEASLDLDANIAFELLRGDYGVTLESRISNLLDKIPNRNASYSSQPWQLGRSAWVGVRVRY